jgi:hypothetical protein
MCSKNIEHIFVFAASAKIWAVLNLRRGPMDAGNKTSVQFNENYLIIVLKGAGPRRVKIGPIKWAKMN